MRSGCCRSVAGHWLICAVVGLLLAGCGDPEVATSPALETVEQELELARHAPLLEVIDGGAALSDFTTDGCSGGLTSGWTRLSERYPEFAEAHGGVPPWEACCVAHDRVYHGAGHADRHAHQSTDQPAVAVEHDGPTTVLESFELRRGADLTLRECVIATGETRAASLKTLYGLSDSQVSTIYEGMGDLMYRAVRLGGIPCTNESWRWGYGWPRCPAATGPHSGSDQSSSDSASSTR